MGVVDLLIHVLLPNYYFVLLCFGVLLVMPMDVCRLEAD